MLLKLIVNNCYQWLTHSLIDGGCCYYRSWGNSSRWNLFHEIFLLYLRIQVAFCRARARRYHGQRRLGSSTVSSNLRNHLQRVDPHCHRQAKEKEVQFETMNHVSPLSRLTSWPVRIKHNVDTSPSITFTIQAIDREIVINEVWEFEECLKEWRERAVCWRSTYTRILHVCATNLR